MKTTITEELRIPEGVQVAYADRTFTVQGPNGTVQRQLWHPKIDVSVEGGVVRFTAKDATQREKRHLYTMRAHLRNLFKGAQEGHVYKLKICSGHFPMNVSIQNGVLTVKNFLGESVPRTLTLKQGVDVKLEGDLIVVKAPYLELAGQQASEIEHLTRITNRDRRIFQDGLFIIEKDGEAVS